MSEFQLGFDPNQVLTPEEEAEAERELRVLGSILSPVSAEQRRQLDTIASFGRRPAIKKESRRQKKAARRGK